MLDCGGTVRAGAEKCAAEGAADSCGESAETALSAARDTACAAVRAAELGGSAALVAAAVAGVPEVDSSVGAAAGCVSMVAWTDVAVWVALGTGGKFATSGSCTVWF